MAAAVVTVAVTAAGSGPRLLVAGEASPALREIADNTWEEFLVYFAERSACIDDVTLRRVWQLDDRAKYQPEERTILMRVPASPVQIMETLTHEFAHHLEATCPEQAALRPAFLEAQDFAAGTEWFDVDQWEHRPSEHFAETVTELVLGTDRFNRLRITVSGEAKDVIEGWATHPTSP